MLRSRLPWLSLVFMLLCAPPAAANDALKVHMISGSGEYKSESSLKLYQQRLEEKFDAEVTASWVGDGATDLPNIDEIADADLLIVFARRMKLPEKQMAKVRSHWEQGKPVIGIRTASHAFSREENESFDKKVLGNHYTGHHGGEDVIVSVASDEVKDHPVLEGVGEIVSRKLYKAGDLADSTTLLQIGTIKEETTHAVTLVNEYNGGRVFYTSLGVPSDFESKEFLTMLDNAVEWVTEQKKDKK